MVQNEQYLLNQQVNGTQIRINWVVHLVTDLYRAAQDWYTQYILQVPINTGPVPSSTEQYMHCTVNFPFTIFQLFYVIPVLYRAVSFFYFSVYFRLFLKLDIPTLGIYLHTNKQYEQGF